MFKDMNNKGMTLIEVVLALAIFGIIASGFLTMFSSSLIWIFGAGDRGEAYSKAQSDLETRIASEDAYEAPDLIVTFDGNDYSIEGGLVESTQVVQQKESTLKTFVPLLPTISINPGVRFEGDMQKTIEITGKRTNLNNTTVVQILDHTGMNQKGNDIIPNSIDTTNQIISFDLANSLPKGEYIIRTKTTIVGEPDELSRAKYTVLQSRFIAVGDGGVYISADGKNWVDRATLPNIPIGVSDLNSVASNGTRYVAVGDGGKVLTSVENAEWNYGTPGTGVLSSVVFSGNYNKFYIVSENGTINTLDTSDTWNSYTSNVIPLYGIESMTLIDGNGALFAIGDEVVLSSVDGISFTSINLDTGDELYSVAYYNGKLVSVGKNIALDGSITGIVWIYDEVLDAWTRYTTGSDVFKDIDYMNDSKQYIAVGDNGVIATSVDGVSWSIIYTAPNNLLGVYSNINELVVVGESGTILYSVNYGVNWVSGIFLDSDGNTLTVTGKLNSVSGR